MKQLNPNGDGTFIDVPEFPGYWVGARPVAAMTAI